MQHSGKNHHESMILYSILFESMIIIKFFMNIFYHVYHLFLKTPNSYEHTTANLITLYPISFTQSPLH